MAYLSELLKRDSAFFSVEADVELSQNVVETVNRQIQELRRPPNDSGSKSAPHHPILPSVQERSLRYRVKVEILPRSGTLRIAEEYLAALNAQGEPTGKRKPFLERMQNRLHLRMEGQAHPTYFERYLDQSILSKPLYPPHYPHLTALRAEMESWMFYYFEPRERMRANTAVKETLHVGPMGEELPAFLNTLKANNPLQFKAIEKALHQIIPSVTGIEVDVNSLGEVELRIQEWNRIVPARVVSEGTLRVLGLLAIGSSNHPPGLIGFEEPENGVHPRRLRLIAERLRSQADTGGNQMIVTTHSPLLMDLIPDESLFVCRKEDGRTNIVPPGCIPPLWKTSEIDRALNEEEAIEDLPVSQRIMRGDFDD